MAPQLHQSRTSARGQHQLYFSDSPQVFNRSTPILHHTRHPPKTQTPTQSLAPETIPSKSSTFQNSRRQNINSCQCHQLLSSKMQEHTLNPHRKNYFRITIITYRATQEPAPEPKMNPRRSIPKHRQLRRFIPQSKASTTYWRLIGRRESGVDGSSPSSWLRFARTLPPTRHASFSIPRLLDW